MSSRGFCFFKERASASVAPLSPPYRFSNRPNVLFRKLHEEWLVRLPAPSIAANAADQPFAVVIDFDKRAIAPRAVAKVIHSLAAPLPLVNSTLLGLCRWALHYALARCSETHRKEGLAKLA